MSQSHEEWLREKLQATKRVHAAGAFREYDDDPCRFAVEVLGLTMWDGLEEILLSLRDNPATYVAGGHKLSKSLGNVAGALWWCAAAHPSRDTRWATVAPSHDQIVRIFWDELDKRLEWLAEHKPQVREKLGPALGKDPRRGWRLTSGGQIIGVATDSPERVAGVSAPWLVINIDEATGYRDDLFLAWQGNEAGGAKFLCTSNPTKPQGWFFDGLHDGEANVIRLSAEDSPNVKAGRKIIPGMASPEWVAKMRRKYGPRPELHPEYQIRVLGIFPSRVENQVLSLHDLRAAQKRWQAFGGEPSGRLVIGVDPARYGVDECVIQPVRGLYAYEPTVLSGATDGKEIAEEVIQVVRRLRSLPADRTVPVVVDGASSGASPVDMLRHSDAAKGSELAVEVHEGFRPAIDEEDYANRRTEVWFGLGDWLKGGGMVPPNHELQKEALAALYKFDARSRQVMEAKDKMKKRLGRSPNRADALTLAVSSAPHDVGEYESDADFEDDLDDW